MAMMVVLVTLATAVAVGVAYALPRLTTRRLRRRFGVEYDRVLVAFGGRRHDAEHELTDRLRLARSVELRPISQQRTESVVHRLGELQEMFVDDPSEAAREAAALLDALLDEFGFPARGRPGLLGVRHPDRLPAYRTAQSTVERARSGEVGTEELRTALLAIRDLCLDVLRAEYPVPRGGRATGPAPAGPPPVTLRAD